SSRPHRGPGPRPGLAAEIDHGPLDRPGFDVVAACGSFLRDDASMARGGGGAAAWDLLAGRLVAPSGRGPLLEADPGAGPSAADGVAREAPWACDRLGPESLGDQLLDPIPRRRGEHPGVVLRASPGDGRGVTRHQVVPRKSRHRVV